MKKKEQRKKKGIMKKRREDIRMALEREVGGKSDG